MIDKNQRLLLAKKSLEGLALGDCFGQTFFGKPKMVCERIANKQIQTKPWNFTDDTVMGVGIYKILEQHGKIHQEELSKVFGKNYLKDWRRGYGGTAHSILRAIADGTGNEFILDIADKVLESDTKYKIKVATQVKKESHIDFAVSVLGNGLSVMAQDTVPFAVWCIAHYMNHLEEALWKAVSALGDMDMCNCWKYCCFK